MVTISTAAQIAIHSLPPQDREQIERLIGLLDQFPKDEWLREKAYPLKGQSDVYVLRATPQLRLAFRSVGDTREVLDIFNHDRLERMFRAAA